MCDISVQLVSVVVPVYNASDYLEDCIESILAQDYPSIEIVLVDDGSQDGSGDICDRYASRFPNRILVIHQANAGPGMARNRGVEVSRGSLIQFLDSDDIISRCFISAMAGVLRDTGADMVRIPLGTSFKAGTPALIQDLDEVPCGELVSRENAAQAVLYQQWETAFTLMMVKREIALACRETDDVVGEDLLATMKMLALCPFVAFIPTTRLYGYRIRCNSLMGSIADGRKVRSALRVSSLLKRLQAADFPELRAPFDARCFSMLRTVFAQTVPGSDESKAVFAELRSYRMTVLTDRNGRRRERLAAAIAILGRLPFRGFCMLCRILGFMR